MTFVGPCVLDVVQHFVERWNEIKERKVCDAPLNPTFRLPWHTHSIPGMSRFILFFLLDEGQSRAPSHYEPLELPHDVDASPGEAVARKRYHPTVSCWA